MSLEGYYKKLYESEIRKNNRLTREMVEIEEEYDVMKGKIDKIKSSIPFKMIKPLWTFYAKTLAAFVRVRRLGSVKEVTRKIQAKRVENTAYKYHGTMSFPDADRREKERGAVFKDPKIFSILVPLYNTSEKYLREMIESVTNQTYPGWELCLADGSDSAHSYVGRIVKEYINKDKAESPDGRTRIKYKRIQKNLGISGNTNVCFELVTGDYIGLFDHDDVLHPSALYYYMREIDRSHADFLYCDETTFSGDSVDKMITLHFKPDFAIDNLRANNYICHFSVFQKELSDKVGHFRSEYDGSQDHDMILRLTAAAKNIKHIPKILYYWRSHEGSTAADINSKTYAITAAKKAVAAHLRSCGFSGFEVESTKAFETIFRIRYALTAHPKISIIIPNKDHAEDLERCVQSIFSRSSYENYEIIIVENNSSKRSIMEYYRALKECPNVKIVRDKEMKDFNFSHLINYGASFATGEYLLLLNNDTEVITRDWMENLLMYAQRDDVGAVGAKLYYKDKTIQHAGIVIGLGAHRTAGHTHYMMAKGNLGYMGRLCYAQDMSAVTGACLMVSKADFDSVGGFDETFAVALNDVDFCLKLREKGRLNVFTPFSELFHYESKSRGNDIDGSDTERAERYNKETALFRERWKKQLQEGDPYYNPNFSLDYSDFRLRIPAKAGKSK
ncbi:MAG: glycosyltransferase [Lachnospiraceae bacterium]|nr:glycosyltransferase [Lachnospiraceae bacterium]